MRARILLAATLAGLWLSGCASGTPHPGTLQDFSSACDKANEGQHIAVEGYLRLPAILTSTSSVELRFYRDLSHRGRPIGVPVRFGDAPDQAKRIVSSFRDTDLVVYLADGTAASFRTKVRVSGTVFVPVGPTPFACELMNPYIEKAK